jgi:hypothetical protein
MGDGLFRDSGGALSARVTRAGNGYVEVSLAGLT